MAAESAHSWADTGNQGLLIVANRRSSRPPDAERPLGYGAEAYVWSLLAAVGLFVVGGTLSVWRGVTELLHGESGAEDYLVAYIVLGVAFALESSSLLQALRQLRGEAKPNTTRICSPMCWRRLIRPAAPCSPRTPRH